MQNRLPPDKKIRELELKEVKKDILIPKMSRRESDLSDNLKKRLLGKSLDKSCKEKAREILDKIVGDEFEFPAAVRKNREEDKENKGIKKSVRFKEVAMKDIRNQSDGSKKRDRPPLTQNLLQQKMSTVEKRTNL